MLAVDTEQLRQHAEAAAGCVDELDTLHKHTQGAGPGPTFTTLPGLRELGTYHRNCLSGPEGSGLQVIAYLARHVGFVVDALRADALAIDRGDGDNAAALAGVLIDESCVILPELPGTGFAPLPQPGAAGADPVALPDLATFVEAVETTNLDEVHRSGWLWGELSRVATEVDTTLSVISRDLAATTEGEGFVAACATLETLASIAKVVALAAQIMQLCVQFIAVIVDILRAVLGLLSPGLAGLETSARVLVERSFLDALPGQLGVLLRHALPPLLSLISGHVKGGVDLLSWLTQRHASRAPQLQWPADVERAMCCCSRCTCHLENSDKETLQATDTNTGAATLGSSAGVGAGAVAAAGVGAPAAVPPGVLGGGVAMAQAQPANVPAGIGVGSPSTRGVASAPMMGPLAAGRGAVPTRTKRPTTDHGATLRC
ncbi:hypothetical protein [Corynebacterium sp.]|uniref:hypothetical protein n=1 Tax=Corynebacterium sp. TaxID=1720 RepID=UPI003735EEAB